MTVKIVTDSTADIPSELAQELGIEVVPLKVRFGTEEFLDGMNLSSEEFYQRLIEGPTLPTTSQPSVGEFAEVYRHLGEGSDGIMSIHLSSKLSGTFNSAKQASEEAKVGCPIEVFDTLQASMAVGLIVLAVARAANAGAGMEELTALAEDTSSRSEFFVMLDTLEYLKKGGRVGPAMALIGGILNIKPMIILRDGEVNELAKERTRRKGVARLIRTAHEFGTIDDMAILHSTTPDEADSLASNLSRLLPEGRQPVISRAGSVIGTYSGPGALGIALIRSATS